MSSDLVIEDVKAETADKRRRRRRENGDVKNPIRVVSSLGEGKLIDRFQSAVSEKEKRRKKNEKSEKMRQIQKEKRDREVAKFKAEINALMEDESPTLKPSEKMTTFVPKLKGTVKGKFEELERKKQEEEKKKAENERRRRNEKDLRDRKMIEIELAKKKLQEGTGQAVELYKAARVYRRIFINNGDLVAPSPGKLDINFESEIKRRDQERICAEAEERKFKLLQERIQILEEKKDGEKDEEKERPVPTNKKTPGKLNASSFEEKARKKEEKERKKAELQRRMKMEAERRAFKELNDEQKSDSEDETGLCVEDLTGVKEKPRKLTTRFDEIARAQEEEKRKMAEKENKRKLEEEKRIFREAKLVIEQEDSESETSNIGSSEIIRKPSKLANSLTKFDVMEKERVENERRRIQERRKKLLEEEMKIFEESKKNLRHEDSTDEDEKIEKESWKRRRPRRLDSSFTQFDIMTRQKLQEKREEIQRERAKLLEDEKRMIAEQKVKMAGSHSEETSSDSSDVRSESEREAADSPEGKIRNDGRKKKLTKRRKKQKTDEGKPSKLDNSKLKFDVLERQRMEKERWQIQEQRRKLLEEEKRIFEEARKQRIQNQEDDPEEESENKTATPGGPRRLDYSKTRFDIVAQHKMEEERQRIREERARLLKEEKKLFEEERAKMKEQDEDDEEETEHKVHTSSKKPNRLDRSFTEFDVLAKKKKEEEREKIKRESQMKLEEEKKMFREAKKMMEENEQSDDDLSAQNSPKTRRSPQKLAKIYTDFEAVEKKRKEEERDRAYHEKLYQLEQEKKLFAEARKIQEEDASDVEEEELQRKQISPSRLSSVLTNFEQTEKQRIEKKRMKAQERKIKEMEEELRRFQEEREKMNESDKEEKSETPTPQVKQPRPKKLSSSFTKFDEIARMRQEEERRRLKAEKERELAEERRRFKESKQDENSGSESEDKASEEPKLHRPINRLNVRQQMEAVLQAQREVEEKRIMETKFCRMTVEQQEMYLAKERQLRILQEKLAKAEADYDEDDYSSEEYTDETESEEEYYSSEEDEYQSYGQNHHEEQNEYDRCYSSPSVVREDMSTPGSNDSGYTGAPWFTETLSNITLKEGKPVRFDAEIHADPHPKVTWYFQNRLIQNSSDYQYINKGTQYSLYMNESFIDDMGEYVCKAENSKGVATSKAMLTIIELED